ncbi:MAG TPA: efflux RND transporter periplasmic adaptor subunit [Gemmatimonadaceae bacterium]|nr:efflux RND transporter periplasmic adaptor subunit [Gemmatimonadaceae bacterium]
MSIKMRVTAAVLAATTLGGVLWFTHRADAGTTPSYRLGKIERGDVKSTVSATGTLGAVRTVEVGTQVSGQISALYVDYNSHVKKGQLIARIDPILQEQAVADAQAGLARSEAVVTQTQLEYDRSKKLHDQQIATDAEFNVAQSNYAQARASLTSARINLQRAKQNLSYTNIYSPIDGVVVERAMDVGQTVAASLSAPKLFVIANDLSRMQILASVDESDIGKIVAGQPVTFTVQSFPDRQFDGSVEQVRLNSTTLNNVVSYTAVVSVSNEDGKLLPGMTASVKLVTASADSVLTVPSTALRFTPPEGAKTNIPARPARAGRDSTAAPTAVAGGAPAGGFNGGGFPGGPGGFGGPNAQRRPRPAGSQPGSMARVWTVDASGTLTPHFVKLGISDGQKTQITSRDLQQGASIVISVTQPGATTATTATTANPLQPQNTQRRGPGGPF